MIRFLLAAFALTMSFQAAAATTGEQLRALPVQDAGRIKPFDTFARETLEIVYGKKNYEGKAAWEIVLTWLLAPSAWSDRELFEIRNLDILKVLQLDPAKRWYRGDEVFGKDRFLELMQELRARRESKEKLTPYFQALQRLENQYFVFREMATGRLLHIAPTAGSDEWVSAADLQGPAKDAFMEMSRRFVTAIGVTEAGSAQDAARMELDKSVIAYKDVARAINPAAYAAEKDMGLEIHYGDFHPFRWAYICYLLAALGLAMAWILEKKSFLRPAIAFVALGFLLHTYGFGLRMYLAGRPPVTNMYETVVWVAWGAIVFSSILEAVYKTRFILFAGAIVGWLSLVIADSAPAVLDPSLQPLEAVLRSNYWLIIHVMTISISYAAFFLAFVLGDIGLFLFLKDPVAKKQKIKDVVNAIYRAMQIGVMFLAPGIILGGVWADYSWGRFWGWDPKETWALIALLGYIAVLHGRLTSWIKDFGMVACAVVTFSLVIMAWYGVNFVLGTGLHSYGFGAGGVEYVGTFLAIQLLFVVYVGVLQRTRNA